MQATDFWDGDNSSDAAMLNRAGVGAILVERKMSASELVVVDIRGQDAAQMALVEDHDVIQTLAANRTDHALDVRVLPRQAWRRYNLRDPIASTRLRKHAPYDASRSPQQVGWSGVPRERFGYLAREPGFCRMLSDRCTHDLPAIVGQNNHHVEQAKRCRRHDKHVDGGDAFGVIAKKAAPGR